MKEDHTGQDKPNSGFFTLAFVFSLILSALFVLDVVTTQLILGHGGIELNPLMAGIVSFPLIHIIIKAGIFLLVIPVAFLAESRVKGSGTVLYAALIVMYTIVVLNNTTVILPHILGSG